MDDFRGKKSSFWPSYVDIMTTLFAIMLVLFCVTFTHFKLAQDRLNAYVKDYKELLSIYKIVENIDTTYFEFKRQYVKHIFKINVTYQTGQFELDKLMVDETNPQEAQRLRDEIFKAGEVIKQTIENLQKKEDLKQDIKYLVVIEGQASKDGYLSYIIFVVQMSDVKYFIPNDKMHKELGDALRNAKSNGVNILAYDCNVTSDTIEIKDEVKVIL